MNSNDAMVFAITAMGKNRKDKGGNPYVGHLMQTCVHLREMLLADGEDPNNDIAMQAAILHDTVEDTTVTLEHLAHAGFAPEVVDLVRVLTHQPGQLYPDYLIGVRGHSRLAVLIKLADMRSNADLTRLPREPDEKQRALTRKYIAGAELLQADEPVTLAGAIIALTGAMGAFDLMDEASCQRTCNAAVLALADTDGINPDLAVSGAMLEATAVRGRVFARLAQLLKGARP